MALKLGLAVLVAAIAVGSLSASIARPDSAAQVMTGFTSRMICSKVFVSGLDPDAAFAEMMEATAGSWLVNWGFDMKVDRERRQIVTRLFGRSAGRAQFRDGLGCMMDHGGDVAAPLVSGGLASKHAAEPPLVEPNDAALAEALDRVFAETGRLRKFTKAVVVMKNGCIIAERYAPDHRIDTPVMGFSATKSVVNALTGVLVREGRLSLNTPAPVAQWSGDERGGISIDHLMRHTSGLALGSSLSASVASAWAPVNQMKFLERDMAGFAMNVKLEAAPGSVWNYSDGNTLILSRIIRDAVGGRGEDVLRFAHRELFAPLGMRNVTLEFDATGTPEGSSQMLAAPRDWARFGQLYLNDGMIGGRRILPSGWVQYSAAPTAGAFVGYGAGFWTNLGDSFGAQNRIGLGMPRDAILARGQFGQYIVIVPSEQLVVTRFGVTGGMNDVEGVSRLVADVIAATRVRASRAPE